MNPCRSKIIFTTVFLLSTSLWPQSGYQLDFVGRISFPADPAGCFSSDITGGTDCWGYTTPDGSEYVIMGVLEGVAFVKVPEMQLVNLTPGPTGDDCYYHRDIQTYRHYAYVTNQNTGVNQGIMIFDLQYLPDSVHFVGTYAPPNEFKSHNMHIDTTTGFAYATRQDRSGIRVIDLSDPESPQDVHSFSTNFSHDVYARNDTLIVSEGSRRRFSIWDMSVKNQPVLLLRFSPPGAGYAHNAWLTDDGKYLMTTEETSGKTVKMWDIRDLGNFTLAGQYLAANNLAHNTHIMGDLAFISHYTYGIAVVDIRDPGAPVEVAAYDTYPLNDGPGFAGSWGVYPYTQSGYVYCSDMEGHLTVLKLTEPAVGIADQGDVGMPEKVGLAQNYPNPFNPTTTIRYILRQPGRVQLSIFNALGQLVRNLADVYQASGNFSQQWDGRNNQGRLLPSGSYYYQLLYRGEIEYQTTRKMTLLR